MQALWTLPASLPRHAFSARDAARAGDVWRAFQEVAVEASTFAGWPPLRYRSEDVAFVMRTMTVTHEREVIYGEKLEGSTWVRSFRRRMFSHREIRFRSERGEIASAAQTWVHVKATQDAEGHWRLAPERAPESLEEAFPVHDAEATHGPSPVMPKLEAREGPTFGLDVEAWIGWMDPLDHVNHPAYVDWADECTARRLRAAGLDPVAMVPVAETATYSRGVTALEQVSVRSRLEGVTAQGDVVLGHVMSVGEARCANVTTVRRVLGVTPDALLRAFV